MTLALTNSEKDRVEEFLRKLTDLSKSYNLWLEGGVLDIVMGLEDDVPTIAVNVGVDPTTGAYTAETMDQDFLNGETGTSLPDGHTDLIRHAELDEHYEKLARHTQTAFDTVCAILAVNKVDVATQRTVHEAFASTLAPRLSYIARSPETIGAILQIEDRTDPKVFLACIATLMHLYGVESIQQLALALDNQGNAHIETAKLVPKGTKRTPSKNLKELN